VASAQRGWAVSAVNGVLALCLVLSLAAFALVVDPPAPPSIAEFAPQATKPITRAPLGQAAAHGEAPGEPCASGAPCGPSSRPTPSGPRPVPLPTGKPTGVPSALQCMLWPDGAVTQTFDPQSPPCIASWDAAAGNGGATAPGVTGSEIRVALPDEVSPVHAALVSFFNSHFQLYGRKIRLVYPYTSGGSATAPDPQEEHAAAQAAVAAHPFAGLSWGFNQSPGPDYLDTLAAAHVIATMYEPIVSGQHLRAHAPYQWAYGMPQDAAETSFAEFVCRSLVGRTSVYAGADVRRTRRFAIVVAKPTTSVDALRRRLHACGADPQVYNWPEPPVDTFGAAADPNQTQMMSQIQNADVTSILTDAVQGQLDSMWSAANSLSYQPEWLLPGLNQYTATQPWTNQGAPSAQAAHLFGLANLNKLVPVSQTPYSQALRESGYNEPLNWIGPAALYHQLMVLAAGIQLSGPDLTPQNFARGLASASFPNPGAAVAPSWQATVGFQSDPWMVKDAGIWWWSPGQTDSVSGAAGGGYCWVGRGSRWKPGTWPSGMQPFTGACR
jgi:hypothetical protein